MRHEDSKWLGEIVRGESAAAVATLGRAAVKGSSSVKEGRKKRVEYNNRSRSF